MRVTANGVQFDMTSPYDPPEGDGVVANDILIARDSAGEIIFSVGSYLVQNEMWEVSVLTKLPSERILGWSYLEAAGSCK